MSSLVRTATEVVVGTILLVVVATVIATQSAVNVGGALNLLILGFVTTALAIALLVEGFNTVKS